MFGKFHQVIVAIVKRPDLVTAMDIEYGQGSSTILVGSHDAVGRSHQLERAKLVPLSARQDVVTSKSLSILGVQIQVLHTPVVTSKSLETTGVKEIIILL